MIEHASCPPARAGGSSLNTPGIALFGASVRPLARSFPRALENDGTAARLNAYRAEGRPIVTVGTTSTRVLETVTSGGVVRPGTGRTSIFIRPPYEFRAADALITNFHMPGLTPIMLVSAFAGHDFTMRAYAEAIERRYRFYSFGDAMVVLP